MDVTFFGNHQRKKLYFCTQSDKKYVPLQTEQLIKIMRMKKVMMMVALLCCLGAMAQGNQASEEAYLQFLYQYMPMPDRADYSRDFYRENVQLSLQARQEMCNRMPGSI